MLFDFYNNFKSYSVQELQQIIRDADKYQPAS